MTASSVHVDVCVCDEDPAPVRLYLMGPADDVNAFEGMLASVLAAASMFSIAVGESVEGVQVMASVGALNVFLRQLQAAIATELHR